MDWSAQQAKYGGLALGNPTPMPVPQKKKRGGLMGFVEDTAKSIIDPFAYLINTDIVNPAKETAAQLTGNKVALRNAKKETNRELGMGENAEDFAGGLKKWAGNSGGALLNFATPAAGSIGKQAALGAGFGASQALASPDSSASDVLTGALGGGAFGGAVGGTSKILGKVLGKGEQVVANKGAKIAENKATQAEQELFEPFRNVPKNVRNSNNLVGTMDFLKSLGVNGTPEEMARAASAVTGNEGAISGMMRELTMSHKNPINVNGFMDTVEEAINNNSPILGEARSRASKGNSLYKNFMSTLQTKVFGGKGSLSGEATAEKVFDAIQDVDKQIRRYSKSAPGTEGEAIADVYKAAKGFLEDKLYNDSGFNAVVAGKRLSPEEEDVIRGLVSGRGAKGNLKNPALGSDKLSEYIINGINSATSGQELRSLQAPFVRASNLSRAAEEALGGALPKAEGAIKDNSRSNFYKALELSRLAKGDVTAAFPLLAGAGKTEKGKILTGAEKVLTSAKGANKKVPGDTTNLLARLTTQAGARNIATPPAPEQPQSDITGANPMDMGGIAGDMGGFDEMGMEQSQYPVENLMADIKRDPKNISEYVTIYKLLNPEKKSTAVKANAQQIGAAQSGVMALQQLSGMLGGGSGTLNKTAVPGQGLPIAGGFLENVLGTGQYNAAAKNLMDAIARIRTGAAMTKSEERMYSQMLPRAGEDPETIRAKLQQLYGILSPYASQQIGDNSFNLEDLISQ